MKGAFTGATRTASVDSRPRNGGTLFLDEIGEHAAALQAKLLRVLEKARCDRSGHEPIQKSTCA